MSDDQAPPDRPEIGLDEVFAELKRVLGDSDPVPPEVMAAAVASRTWRRVDAELAELVYDSLVDAELVRSSRGGRRITFEGPELTVELEVGPASIDGQLVPAQRGQVEVRHPEGSLTVAADDFGHFRVDEALHGPVSLRCHPERAESPTVTSWIII